MKKEAPARLFWIVAHMLTGLEVERSLFDNFMEVAHRDYVPSYLKQMLKQNDKLFCFDSALETLEKALDYCDVIFEIQPKLYK